LKPCVIFSKNAFICALEHARFAYLWVSCLSIIRVMFFSFEKVAMLLINIYRTMLFLIILSIVGQLFPVTYHN
jgi:hypothetical protein